MVAYYGSVEEFDAFKTGHPALGSIRGCDFYFTDVTEVAASYAAGLEPLPPIHQRTGQLLPLDPLRSVPVVDLSDEERAALRELGYVD